MNRTFKPPQYDTEHPPGQIVHSWTTEYFNEQPKEPEMSAIERAYNKGFSDGVLSTQPKDKTCALLKK